MPKTIAQKVIPEVEFAKDHMMCKLHKTRIKIYSETRHMNAQKIQEYFQKKSREFRNG